MKLRVVAVYAPQPKLRNVQKQKKYWIPIRAHAAESAPMKQEPAAMTCNLMMISASVVKGKKRQ